MFATYGTLSVDTGSPQSVADVELVDNTTATVVLQFSIGDMVAGDSVEFHCTLNIDGDELTPWSAVVEFGVTTSEMWADGAVAGDTNRATVFTSPPIPVNGFDSGNTFSVYATYTGSNAGFDMPWVVFTL